MKQWRDVTFALEACFPVWPGDAPFSVEPVARMSRGDTADVSALHMSAHFGTHMDAPAHYLPGGAAMEQAPLELLMGSTYLLDARGAGEVIGEETVKRVPADARRVLIRSDYETHSKKDGFFPGFSGLGVAATAWLKAMGVRLLGADAPSFAALCETRDVHRLFLCDDEHWIIEHLDLRDCPEGWYDLLCLPMKIKGCEGAPARVLLRAREEQP
ncbi:MAG: cyclase family protein [Eubacteriales bacterium]|nr:cyclase family protein [Eubacteriales bacterium]